MSTKSESCYLTAPELANDCHYSYQQILITMTTGCKFLSCVSVASKSSSAITFDDNLLRAKENMDLLSIAANRLCSPSELPWWV